MMLFRHLNQVSVDRGISKTTWKHCKKDVFLATSSRMPLKTDIICVMSLRRLEYISKNVLYVMSLRCLKYISKNMSFI